MTRNEAILFAMSAYGVDRDEAEEMYDQYLEAWTAREDEANARRTCITVYVPSGPWDDSV